MVLNSTQSLTNHASSPLILASSDLPAIQQSKQVPKGGKLYIINSTQQGPQLPQLRSVDGWLCKTVFMDELVTPTEIDEGMPSESRLSEEALRMQVTSSSTEGVVELSQRVIDADLGLVMP